MHGTRRLGAGVTGHPTWEAKLLEQALHPRLVLRDVRVNFGVVTIQVGVRHHHLTTVTGAFDVEHVDTILINDTVQVSVDEVLPRNRAPVADWVRLNITCHQLPLQQRVILEVELANGQIVGSLPVAGHQVKVFGRRVILCSHSITSIFQRRAASLSLI